ncbi:hypothetical protein KAR91_77765 [Candidatus Pacearchaeota archaeon]|nr:hypothetical protein [Candidatus Pacearchaeota archaeon]
MKQLSKDALRKARDEKKISKRDYAKTKQVPSPKPTPQAKSDNSDIIKAIEGLAKGLESSNQLPDAVIAITAAIKAMAPPVINPVIKNEVKMPVPVKKWKFTIERDTRGLMSDVKVVAID